MAKPIRYPTGVRPLLVDEARRRRAIEERFVGTLEAARFEEILLPTIDYVEPYTGVVTREGMRQSYRFVDREGELVAIRSDFTPMVARAVAPSLSAADLPLRLFYRGDVIRCEATRLGANREMFQIGAELIGDGSAQADVEMIALAARCVAAFGVRPLVVYTDASIAAALFESASSDDERDAIRTALLSKRTNGKTLDPLVSKIANGTATLDDIEGWPPAADAARRLRSIGSALESSGGADFVLQLDDVEPQTSYYTGIRFRLYGGASRARLAQGGRYDSLYGEFGTSARAIGFTFTIDDMADVAARAAAADQAMTAGGSAR